MIDHDSDIGEANEMLVMPWHRVFTPNVAESGYSDLAVSKVRFDWCLVKEWLIVSLLVSEWVRV